ncbi:MAG: Gfo/Idh/MocA family oxidoreductase [Planctomycetia bacterium]|nr:Gfo/Idh/MocA family oxidoreductase [Planctomycetia bacterium]
MVKANQTSRTKVNRRQFLRQSVSLGACSFFIPYLYSSSQPARAEGVNDKITVAAIGTSEYRAGIWDNEQPFDGRGSQIGRKAGSLGLMLAVADVHRPFAERFAAYYPGQCKVYQDYREVLADPGIDAVTIGTPDHWHAKIAIEAMKAGKHVYVEKPLTLTMEESRLIAQAARETGQIVQVGSQQRTENETFIRAAALCRSGRLGSRLAIRCSCPANESIAKKGVFDDRTPFQTQPVPEGLDWNAWLGPAPWREYVPERCFYNFRWWLDYSGGEITNWGGHNVDFAVWAVNATEDAPVEISGTGTFPGIDGWYDTAESFDVLFKYENGNTLQLCSGPNEVIISGEKGRIRVNRGRLTGKPVEQLTKQDEESLAAVINDLMKGQAPGDHMKNFFDAIKLNRQPVSDVASTVSGINMCHMANICLRLGRPLRWNQKAYEFEGDQEATAMISRERRKGFEIEM